MLNSKTELGKPSVEFSKKLLSPQTVWLHSKLNIIMFERNLLQKLTLFNN